MIYDILCYEELTEEKRPQDLKKDGSTLKFETLEHGGEYPDLMPQAIRVTDTEGRSCLYHPVLVRGRVVKYNHGAFYRSIEGLTQYLNLQIDGVESA
jgi:hypothetical protein